MREQEIQKAVFQHFAQRGAPNTFAFHPKNGGIHQRGRRAGINTGQGVIAGVPDVIAIKDGKTYGLELKADKGAVSPEQVEILQTMQRAGATVAVVHGLDRALHKLEEWGLLKGAAS
jgi:hypothetical protein